jgi:nicotinamide-nucleotide amidase
MTSSAIDDLTGQLAHLLPSRGLMVCTAESCTGGLIAAACTDRAGSSVWFERGFVTYSNASKADLLGVPANLIARHGAVSQEVARAMAAGALTHAQAQLAVAVTGVAGPGGGSADKPMGSQARTERQHFEGDRSAVRQATVARALQGLIEMLQTGP